MNAFANTLFSLLLGWVKGLLQSVYGMFSGGKVSSFFVWLGDHWLGVVVVVCLAGAVADLIIWLLRWRPDLVWRTRLRHLFGHRTDMGTRQFRKGYNEAVDIQQDAAAVWPQPAEYQPQEEIWWDMPESVPAQKSAQETLFMLMKTIFILASKMIAQISLWTMIKVALLKQTLKMAIY